MHLYNLTCLSSFFSYKKLSKKFATCAISYLSCQIRYSKNYPPCNISHVHCAIYSQTTGQKMLSKPCPLCNILLDKRSKNVVLHTTKSILAWKNVNKIKLHFELKQTWENFTIIELTIYYFFTYQKSAVFAGKHLYFQHMELVHNWT